MKCRINKFWFEARRCANCGEIPRLLMVKKLCVGRNHVCERRHCARCVQAIDTSDCLEKEESGITCEECGFCYIPPETRKMKHWTGFRYVCKCFNVTDKSTLDVYRTQQDAVKKWNDEQRLTCQWIEMRQLATSATPKCGLVVFVPKGVQSER